jgi:hypothetical protein
MVATDDQEGEPWMQIRGKAIKRVNPATEESWGPHRVGLV